MSRIELRDLGGGTIGGLLEARAAAAPDNVAVLWKDTPVSYGELDARVDSVAYGLVALGAEPQDRVAILMENRIEFLYAWYGAMRAGLVQVPINTAYKASFLEYVLDHSGSSVLITEAKFSERLADLDDWPKGVRLIVYVDSEPGEAPWPGVEVTSWENLITSGGDAVDLPEVAPDDVSAVLYTSGTTGRSKGVVTPHMHNLVMGREAAQAMEVTTRDRLYTCLPMFHANAQMATCMNALYAGATVALGSRFSASGFWDELRRTEATEFNAIGSIIYMLLSQPPSPRDRDHRVERAFLAPAPPDALYRFESRFGVHLIEGYGQTEIKNVTYNPYRGRRVGSIGRPSPTSIVEIHDADGHEVPPGVVGEIVYRPKAAHIICKEYLRDPEATLSATRDLWWHTGDLGHRDRDGFLYFSDRMKDALRRRGENISSQELEAVVASHPLVGEVAAIGVASDVGEDEIMVVLEASDEGAGLSLQSLFDHCDRLLPYYMVPRYFRLIEEFPRTANGKVQKAVLRTDGVTPDTWDCAVAGLVPTRLP